jgi:hypothetical protein
VPESDVALAPARPAKSRLRLPTFLVIGAARSGTTTLHYCLGQHPEIFVSPIKETNFFVRDEAGRMPRWTDEDTLKRTPRTLEEYAALFADTTERHRAIGESSPGYLHGPVAPRIKAQLPDARLIAILRHPVEQAFSYYATWYGVGEQEDGLVDHFVGTLEARQPGPNGALPLCEHGLFHRHLHPYFDHFDRDQIMVVLMDDLERNPAGLFADLFRFVGADPHFRLDGIPRYNQTGAAKSVAVQWALSAGSGMKQLARAVLPTRTVHALANLQHRLRSSNLRRVSELSPELRRQLTERFYGDDIGALEHLLRRDLSIWRH